jgi:hypothetical protein
MTGEAGRGDLAAGAMPVAIPQIFGGKVVDSCGACWCPRVGPPSMPAPVVWTKERRWLRARGLCAHF